jgi:hypothetical protein
MGDFVYFLGGVVLFMLVMAHALRSNRIEAQRRKDHPRPRFYY